MPGGSCKQRARPSSRLVPHIEFQTMRQIKSEFTAFLTGASHVIKNFSNVRRTAFAAMMFMALAASGKGASLDFPKGKVGYPHWATVHSHLKGQIKMGVEPVTGQPFDDAATLVLADEAFDAAGKATYLRSRPLKVDTDVFTIEWYENNPEGLPGLSFELWSEMSNNKIGTLLLGLKRKFEGFTFAGDLLCESKPGWRHYKLVVDGATGTADFYCDDMTKPAADGLPLKENIEDPSKLAIGFILYVPDGTPPATWQVGGVSVENK